MERGPKTFKEALNEAVRQGLGQGAESGEAAFVVKARDLGLRAGIDPANLRDLGDELEVDEFLRKTRRLETSPP